MFETTFKAGWAKSAGRAQALPTAKPGETANPTTWRRAAETTSALTAMAALITVMGPVMLSQNTSDDTSPNKDTPAASKPVAPPTKEFMIGGYGGMPYTYPSDVMVKNPGVHDFTVKDVEWEGKPFKAPIYYGIRIIRWFEGGNTGAMLDFTHSKAIARLTDEKEFSGTFNGATAPEKAKLSDIFRRLEASHGHNMLMLNGLMRLPSVGNRVFPYIGIGAGVSVPHAEVHLVTDPSRTYEYQYTGPAAQGLIGLEFRVKNISYFIEYKFTFASYEIPLTHENGTLFIFDIWKQIQRAIDGMAAPGGSVSTTFASHEAIAGVGVRLGASPAAATP